MIHGSTMFHGLSALILIIAFVRANIQIYAFLYIKHLRYELMKNCSSKAELGRSLPALATISKGIAYDVRDKKLTPPPTASNGNVFFATDEFYNNDHQSQPGYFLGQQQNEQNEQMSYLQQRRRRVLPPLPVSAAQP